MDNAEKYSITLDREGGIHPDEISARTLADFLRILSKLLNSDNNDLCLTSIADNCINLNFKIAQTLKASAVALSAFISGENVEAANISPAALQELDTFRNKLPGISLTFSPIDKYPEITVPPEKKLSDLIKKAPEINYSRTIYGKVTNVGGEHPNFHIKMLGTGASIICDCSEELAAEVAHHLYSTVGVSGSFSQNTNRMKADTLLPYREPETNPFDVLRASGIGKYFENETVEAFMNRIRGTEDENV